MYIYIYSTYAAPKTVYLKSRCSPIQFLVWPSIFRSFNAKWISEQRKIHTHAGTRVGHKITLHGVQFHSWKNAHWDYTSPINYHLFEALKQTFGDKKFNDICEFKTIVTQYTTRTFIKMKLGSAFCKVINSSHVLETMGISFKCYELNILLWDTSINY